MSEAKSMSAAGLALLRELEGSAREAYQDVAGIWTIGVGHRLTHDELMTGKIRIGGAGVRYGGGLTEAQIETLLRQDLKRFEAAVNKAVKMPLEQHQFDAAVSLSFNIGASAFAGSTLVRKLNRGSYAEVPSEMRRWHWSAGRPNVLAARREREVGLWEGRA